MAITYRLKNGITVRLPALSPAITEASADDLRVLYAMAASGYTASIEELATTLGCSLTRAAAAVEYWTESGILIKEQKTYLTTDELPRGTAADDARVIREEQLKDCLDTCGEILGKLLNPAEINILVSLIRELGISELYLVTLLDFCVNKLDGRGVKYLEKVAISLCDRGIRTPEALEEYIKRQEAVRSVEGQIRKLYGMGARTLTEKEREILDVWINTYRYGMDVIGIAYDITANVSNKVTVRYTHKILEEWHQNGLSTTAEIDAFLKAKEAQRNTPKKKAPKKQTQATSFDVNSFFEDALNRSYKQE